MSCARRSLIRRAVGTGLIVGVLAGASAGCSGNSSTNLDVKAARASLAKHRGDYGEVAKTPVAPRRQGN